MCNRFIEEFSTQIVEQASTCNCFELKNNCELQDPNFEFISYSIRDIFLHGYVDWYHHDHTPIFQFYEFRRDFVDMALCYLHEQDIFNFHELISYFCFLKQKTLLNQEEILEAKKLIKSHLSCVPTKLFKKYLVHVGFGSYNERCDVHKVEDKTYMRNTKPSLKQNLYMPYTRWLMDLLTYDDPRSYWDKLRKELLDDVGSEEDKYLEDYELDDTLSLQHKDSYNLRNDFKTKLIESVIAKYNCKCISELSDICKSCKCINFNYSSKEIRYDLNNFPIPDFIKMLYEDDCNPTLYNSYLYKGDEGNNETRFNEEFISMALCMLHEGDIISFCHILNSSLDHPVYFEIFKEMLIPHLNCLKPLINNYRVGMNKDFKCFEIYKVEDDTQGGNTHGADAQDFEVARTRRRKQNRKGSNTMMRRKYPFYKSQLNITLRKWIHDILYIFTGDINKTKDKVYSPKKLKTEYCRDAKKYWEDVWSKGFCAETKITEFPDADF